MLDRDTLDFIQRCAREFDVKTVWLFGGSFAAMGLPGGALIDAGLSDLANSRMRNGGSIACWSGGMKGLRTPGTWPCCASWRGPVILDRIDAQSGAGTRCL